jgi:predicted HTH transcriptional regulator
MLTDNTFQYVKVQCGLFKGTDRVVFIDKREFKGPLYEQIEQAYNFVLKHINLGAEIQGLIRKDIYELPIKSIREMIVNAVTHRNYSDNSAVQVAVYEDRVEVTSPGMLSGGLKIEDIINGTSNIRNKVIAEVFSHMHIIEDWGTGIRRMIGGCREYGISDPEFIELGSKLRVNIYRERKYKGPAEKPIVTSNVPISDPDVPNNVPINSTEALVLAIVREKPYITAANLADLISRSEKTAKRNLSSIKKKGLIIRIGANKDGYWQLINEE